MKKLRGNVSFVAALLLGITSALVVQITYSHGDRVLPDAALHLLKHIALPQPGERVLLFSPHPDDETIGAGGYLAMSVQNGSQVRIVLVTDGNKHGFMNKRYHEFRGATRILGVPEPDLLFLNLPDGHVREEPPAYLEAQFKAIIATYDPHIVIYPDPRDHHPDHSAVGKIIEKVVKTDFPKKTCYQYLVHHARFPYPKKLREDAPLLPPSSMVRFDNEWQRLMLPPAVEEQKLQAVFEYSSQLKVPLLRSLLLSLVRKNELFAVPAQEPCLNAHF